jgi:hypothetical protein
VGAQSTPLHGEVCHRALEVLRLVEKPTVVQNPHPLNGFLLKFAPKKSLIDKFGTLL